VDARSQEEMVEHLFAHSILDEATGCILWQGCKAGKGYGVTCWQGKQVYVHKLAYKFEYPDEIQNVVRHTCDTSSCWRLDHLINGTTQDNIDDMLTKHRHMHGSNHYNTIFTEEDIKLIRASTLENIEVARIYGVNNATIHYIRKGKTWTHVQ